MRHQRFDDPLGRVASCLGHLVAHGLHGRHETFRGGCFQGVLWLSVSHQAQKACKRPQLMQLMQLMQLIQFWFGRFWKNNA